MKNHKILFSLLFILLITGCGFKSKPATVDLAGKQDPQPSEVADNNQPLPYKLDLSGQGLIKVPDTVFKKKDLVELDISGNKLTGALQAEIRNLSKLVVLNLSNNQFTGVPAEVGQLSKLEILNLSNNQLTGLPYELGNLQNLKVLNISGNNYSEQDLAIIQQKLPTDINIIK